MTHLALCILIGFCVAGLVSRLFSHERMERLSPAETVDLYNRYAMIRVCHKCKSARSRYDVGKDAIVCLDCGSSDDREWALAHPEISA